MRPIFVLTIAIAVAGCDVPNNTAQTSAQGTTEIAFQDGKNCWNNRCINFKKKDRWISITGRNPVPVPREIDLRDGYVTEAEFNQMFETANRALSYGAGRASR